MSDNLKKLRDTLEPILNDDLIELLDEISTEFSELEDKVEDLPDFKTVDLGLDKINYYLEKQNLKVSNQLESAFELIKY